MCPPANPESEDPRIGRTLGRYRIEKRLGRGGMGVVYQGHQLSLNRPVAIKVLPPQMAADGEFRERFRREAHAVAALAHENIVHIYDIEEADGAYFLVMELVPGQTLRAQREARRFTAAEVVAIGIALARALGCAHRQGILHRDVKSQNVMVTPDGVVKLMDFGIARMSDGGVKTATGHVLGTPESMAPEQALTGTSSVQSDLYSLGVLLFEIATGRLPFTGAEPFAVAYKHIHEPVPAPRSLDPAIPAGLERVILRLLEKDPAHRYASAADLERDLAAAIGAAPALGPAATVAPSPAATAPTVLTPTGAQGRGTYATLRLPARPWPWLVAAGVVVAAGAGLWWWAPGPTRSGPAAETPPPAPPTQSFAAAPAAPPAAKPSTAPAVREPAPRPRPQTQVATQSEPAAESPAVAVPAPRPELPAEPPPELPVSATFRCRLDVDFDVSPEEALVVIDGAPLGPADDWDGAGGGKTWHPTSPTARACFRLAGYQGTCVRIVLDPRAEDETCNVDTELEENP